MKADTPAPIVDKLKSALTEAMKSPWLQAQLRQLSIPASETSVDDLPAQLEKELAEFTADSRKQGLLPQ